ncbi:hypothetical protein [Halobaculum limi]|uniref:hypothetical protein n=1 Tax=Halobaculum limi TaxID=3031916 RepID=UPI002404F600|nr:hypothetical protein [Halobaculum sp. YSMS11]
MSEEAGAVPPQNEDAETPPTTDAESPTDLQARVDLLATENQRLREEYARRQQVEYRRAALGLGGVGAVALTGAALFPAVRSVLIIIGAVGLFGGILTRYLTPERFVSADVGERVYSALAGNEAAITAELGLQSERIYVPVEGTETARLFIPERREYDIPPQDELESTLVIPDDPAMRGVALTPTGGPLFREFEQSAPTTTDALRDRVDQLTEAFVETFEIADAVDADLDAADGRVTIDVRGSVFGVEADFDDPITSLFAVGLAEHLDVPIRTERAGSENDYAMAFYWEPEEAEQAAKDDASPAGDESERETQSVNSD